MPRVKRLMAAVKIVPSLSVVTGCSCRSSRLGPSSVARVRYTDGTSCPVRGRNRPQLFGFRGHGNSFVISAPDAECS